MPLQHPVGAEDLFFRFSPGYFMGDGACPAKPPHQGAVNVERLDTFIPEPPQHPRDPFRFAAEHVLNQVEHVVAGAVHHHIQRRLAADFLLVHQQCQFINFLLRRQQVSFDPLRHQRGGFPGNPFIPAPATGHNPTRQFGGLNRPDLYAAPALFQRLEPFRLLGLPVDAARSQQQQVIGRMARRVVGQGCAAFPARLVVAQPELDDAFAGKQGQVGAGFLQPAPVKPGIQFQDDAFVVAKFAGAGADQVSRLLQLQGLITADVIDRQEFGPVQVRRELL